MKRGREREREREAKEREREGERERELRSYFRNPKKSCCNIFSSAHASFGFGLGPERPNEPRTTRRVFRRRAEKNDLKMFRAGEKMSTKKPAIMSKELVSENSNLDSTNAFL